MTPVRKQPHEAALKNYFIEESCKQVPSARPDQFFALFFCRKRNARSSSTPDI